ncbi:RNB-like protein [Babesia divergens]|uniref:RNB-like protein n=1 Tax=Babesia divergens TaxID=32595 RepID=A0AAD9GAU7_BABDI|nr:RNB-like protein [Babesia divergens]
MTLLATSARHILETYARFLPSPWQRRRFVDIIVCGRYKHCQAQLSTDRCYNEADKNCSINTASSTCTVAPTQKQKTQTIGYDIAYETYWDEESIVATERKQPELLVRGTVVIPAFATSEARIMEHRTNEADKHVECAKSDHMEFGSDQNSHNTENSYQATNGIQHCEFDATSGAPTNANKPIDVNQMVNSCEFGDGKLRNNVKGVRIFGFLARNRAFHGDEVVGLRQRRLRECASQPLKAQVSTDQCRVIRVTKRSPALSCFVAVLDTDSCLNSSSIFKCQPQDTRWPAFNVYRADIDPKLWKQIEEPGNVGKILCLMRFEEWHENDMEPRGSIIRIIGNVSNPDAQMEASMVFHGLNPHGFSDAVIEDLKKLIKHTEGVREHSRLDYRDHLVFTIDPQDAKDLDDALSVEILKDSNANCRYRVGVHIADVSHYVKEGSLVDLDARQRATSVYLEHRVFPMLPHHLSENLCSLLPNSEKLCFSMFADLTDDPCGGEMVGTNLYIKNQSFALTRIISKKRLSYQSAKDIIFKRMQNTPGAAASIMESMGISEFQKNIVDPQDTLTLPSEVCSTQSADYYGDLVRGSNKEQSTASSDNAHVVDDSHDNELSKALLILYFIAGRLRNFRLKQRGAVMVDTNGSQKCHIPRVDKITANFWIERIPKESHELVEEMMLLANTQAAQLLAKSFDRYFLRVHEDTSNAIKKLVSSKMPQNLRNIINPDVMNIPELLRKCAKHMEQTAFQSLSFAALQQFKEAVYSPVDKDDKFTTAISGHWGLALPMYLHFTSPIRRYSDLYTHRMLKTVIDGTYTEQSLKKLDEICSQCNMQKRKAFDVQKDYKNFAFNQYLRWACTAEGDNKPYAASDSRFTRCLNKEGRDVWGMIYEDACVFSIVLSDPQIKDATSKSSIIFYIPILAEQRGVSCDALNIEPIEAFVCGERIRLGSNQPARNPGPMVDGYLKEVQKKGPNQKEENPIVQSITVRKGNDQITLSQYQKVSVVLIPGSQMWTLRLPNC